jgi:alpha-D-ribose 1-methylphosphonate 5-triphosphate synthase subunit PhnG
MIRTDAKRFSEKSRPNDGLKPQWIQSRRGLGVIAENHATVIRWSWRLAIKLSIIIDNLNPARFDVMADPDDGIRLRRKAAMAVLAHATTAELAKLLDRLDLPVCEDLREPENGLVMVRGRIGGDGAAFNLGEATVSRAAVRLSSGEIGFGYVLGRDKAKARMIALCDALMQTRDGSGIIETQVVTPLREAMVAARAQRAAEAAATRVDFYTMVRGEG